MKQTESPSLYDNLEKMDINTILTSINHEDRKVPIAIEKAIPQLEKLIEVLVEKLQNNGRLFYIGAGTSGRLGIVDASECPPTYGVPAGMVVGIMAGGDGAIRKAVEGAEDDPNLAIIDLKKHDFNKNDVVIGIAASGRTPYVIGGLEYANSLGAITGCVVCNTDSVIAKTSKFPVEIIVGPEFVTGSTRMKAGTAQKLALNMITTATMIQLGKVKGNKMVNMMLTNEKLVDRGTKMVMDELKLNYVEAQKLLLKYGSVNEVLKNHS
jgi:N-acetylmuramic acid 6-phosphate etherase